jgi:hypothetical protein
LEGSESHIGRRLDVTALFAKFSCPSVEIRVPYIERFFLSRKIAFEFGLTLGNDAPTIRIFVKKDSRYLGTVTIAKNDFVRGHEHVPFLLARILTESLHPWRITASSESREENQQFTVLQCSPVRFNPLANVTCLFEIEDSLAHSLTGLNGGKMHPTFAIFAMLPDGQPFWIESVENLEDARERLREVASWSLSSTRFCGSVSARRIPSQGVDQPEST